MVSSSYIVCPPAASPTPLWGPSLWRQFTVNFHVSGSHGQLSSPDCSSMSCCTTGCSPSVSSRTLSLCALQWVAGLLSYPVQGSSVGCRWISAHPRISIACRGISALASETSSSHPSLLTLVSAELFLSLILLLLFSGLNYFYAKTFFCFFLKVLQQRCYHYFYLAKPWVAAQPSLEPPKIGSTRHG